MKREPETAERRCLMSDESLRIGVFVCDCGRNIAAFVDTEEVTRFAAELPDVVVAVQEPLHLRRPRPERDQGRDRRAPAQPRGGRLVHPQDP